MKKSIIYILTPKNFKKEVLNSKQLVLVEFSTEWCGTSHIIAPIIKEMAITFNDDIKFCTIDIDEYGELSKKYGVQKIPTILFFNKGKVVDFIIGAVSREALINHLRRFTIKKKN